MASQSENDTMETDEDTMVEEDDDDEEYESGDSGHSNESSNEKESESDGDEDTDEEYTDDEEDSGEDEEESDGSGQEEDGSDGSEEEEEEEENPAANVTAGCHNAEYDSDQSNGTSERCPVCLGRIRDQNVGTPESCDHNFCLECILEWSKNVNTCPVDRQVFHIILAKHSVDGTVYKQIPIEDRQIADEEEEEATYCEICGRADREDRMLLCDGCDLGYHMECLEPPIEHVPVEEWFCVDCEPPLRPTRRRSLHGQDDDMTLEILQVTYVRRTMRRRQVPRTTVSERVRATIAARRRANRIVSDSEDEMEVPTSTPCQPSTSTAKPKRKYTPRKTTKKKTTKKKTTKKRKRITKKGKSTKRKKKGSKSRKKTSKGKRKKKTKWRKYKRTARTAKTTPTTTKVRLAGRLGIAKPPAGRMIPSLKSRASRTMENQLLDAGATSLSIFGSRHSLDPLLEDNNYSEDEAVAGTGGSTLVARPAGIRTRIPTKAALKQGPWSRTSVRHVPPKPSVDSSSPFDLLGSIMNGQDKLQLKSENVTIKRDGSLEAIKPDNNTNSNTKKLAKGQHSSYKVADGEGGSGETGGNEQNPSSSGQENADGSTTSGDCHYQNATDNAVSGSGPAGSSMNMSPEKEGTAYLPDGAYCDSNPHTSQTVQRKKGKSEKSSEDGSSSKGSHESNFYEPECPTEDTESDFMCSNPSYTGLSLYQTNVDQPSLVENYGNTSQSSINSDQECAANNDFSEVNEIEHTDNNTVLNTESNEYFDMQGDNQGIAHMEMEESAYSDLTERANDNYYVSETMEYDNDNVQNFEADQQSDNFQFDQQGEIYPSDEQSEFFHTDQQNENFLTDEQNENFTPDEQNENFTTDEQNENFDTDEQNENFDTDEQNENFAIDERNENFTGEEQNENFTTDEQNENFTIDEQNENFTTDDQTENFTGEERNENFTPDEQTENFTGEEQNEYFPVEEQNENFPPEEQNENFTAGEQNENFTTEEQNENFTAEEQNENFTAGEQNENFTAEEQNENLTANDESEIFPNDEQSELLTADENAPYQETRSGDFSTESGTLPEAVDDEIDNTLESVGNTCIPDESVPDESSFSKDSISAQEPELHHNQISISDTLSDNARDIDGESSAFIHTEKNNILNQPLVPSLYDDDVLADSASSIEDGELLSKVTDDSNCNDDKFLNSDLVTAKMNCHAKIESSNISEENEQTDDTDDGRQVKYKKGKDGELVVTVPVVEEETVKFMDDTEEPLQIAVPPIPHKKKEACKDRPEKPKHSDDAEEKIHKYSHSTKKDNYKHNKSKDKEYESRDHRDDRDYEKDYKRDDREHEKNYKRDDTDYEKDYKKDDRDYEKDYHRDYREYEKTYRESSSKRSRDDRDYYTSSKYSKDKDKDYYNYESSSKRSRDDRYDKDSEDEYNESQSKHRDRDSYYESKRSRESKDSDRYYQSRDDRDGDRDRDRDRRRSRRSSRSRSKEKSRSKKSKDHHKRKSEKYLYESPDRRDSDRSKERKEKEKYSYDSPERRDSERSRERRDYDKKSRKKEKTKERYRQTSSSPSPPRDTKSSREYLASLKMFTNTLKEVVNESEIKTQKRIPVLIDLTQEEYSSNTPSKELSPEITVSEKRSGKKSSDKKSKDKKSKDKNKKSSDKILSDKISSENMLSDKKVGDKKSSDKVLNDKKSDDKKASETEESEMKDFLHIEKDKELSDNLESRNKMGSPEQKTDKHSTKQKDKHSPIDMFASERDEFEDCDGEIFSKHEHKRSVVRKPVPLMDLDFSRPLVAANSSDVSDSSSVSHSTVNEPTSDIKIPGLSEPPPDLRKPLPGFDRTHPDLSKPPPDLSIPPPVLSQSPPDTSKPPPNYSEPPPDLSQPPPGLNLPVPDLSQIRLPTENSSFSTLMGRMPFLETSLDLNRDKIISKLPSPNIIINNAAPQESIYDPSMPTENESPPPNFSVNIAAQGFPPASVELHLSRAQEIYPPPVSSVGHNLLLSRVGPIGMLPGQPPPQIMVNPLLMPGHPALRGLPRLPPGFGPQNPTIPLLSNQFPGSQNGIPMHGAPPGPGPRIQFDLPGLMEMPPPPLHMQAGVTHKEVHIELEPNAPGHSVQGQLAPGLSIPGATHPHQIVIGKPPDMDQLTNLIQVHNKLGQITPPKPHIHELAEEVPRFSENMFKVPLPPAPEKTVTFKEKIHEEVVPATSTTRETPVNTTAKPPVISLDKAPLISQVKSPVNAPVEQTEVIDMDVASPQDDEDFGISFSPPDDILDTKIEIKLDEVTKEDIPASAVELDVQSKFMKKLNRQERVVEEVKLAIKPYYSKGKIDKEEYKDIMRKAVPKICHSKKGDINPIRIREYIEQYVVKIQRARKWEDKKSRKGVKKKNKTR